MIKTYGIRITANDPKYGKILKRREISAGSKAEATECARGWCIVQGYEIRPDSFEVETDGMTYREDMTRELVSAAGRLSLRYGVEMVGPFELEPRFEGDPPRTVVRLWVPGSGGYGISLSSKLSDAFNVDTEMVTIREDVADRYGYKIDFSMGVLECESRVVIGEEYDGEIGEIIEGLAKLPRR